MKCLDLISIIIPILNIEKCLGQCLDSVISQTYANTEIILIDDGSTDSSGAICNEFALKDNRIIVVHQENRGLSNARNAGINIAKGEFIAFVDADDILDENFIMYLYNACVDNDVRISMCRKDEFNSLDELSSIQSNNYSGTIYDSKELQKWLYTKNRSLVIYSWNKLYHRSVFDNLRYPDGKVFENSYFTPRALDTVDKMFFVDNVLYHYRQVPNGLSKSVNGEKYVDLIWCLEETRKFYLEKNYDELYKLLMVFILNKCVDSYFYCYQNLEHDDKCYELMKFFKDKYGECYKECCDRGVFDSWSERVKYRWRVKCFVAFVKGSVAGGLKRVVKGK